MLRLIAELQETSFVQPRHWDHEPTTEELTEEDELCKQAQRDFEHLEKLVDELSRSLKSPFL